MKRAILKAYDTVRNLSTIVEPSRWQSIDVSKQAAATTHEVLNYTLRASVPESLDELRAAVEPNLPWADDHFLERVGGKPLNPGVEWAHWPWANSANSFRTTQVMAGPMNPHAEADGDGIVDGFSHTYMERMWPKLANQRVGKFFDQPISEQGPHTGIRYGYGDAASVIDHLAEAPDSRQAYLPIWFPEDTGKLTVRVPCTLGYHFIHRHGFLHCVYYIRSCDLYRHFRDDVYLTARLQLWVLEQLQKYGPTHTDEGVGNPVANFWAGVKPGTLTMHITSLHCFVNDARKLWPDKK